jgi:hypothetical protein
MPYEHPTDDLRQVLVEHWEQVGPEGATEIGYRILRGLHYRVQRKWLVFDGVPSDPKQHFMGTMDGTEINGVKGRPEWCDLPIVSETEAQTPST